MSDRQWRDILGIVLVQGNRLDEDYLRRGADLLSVADLLGRGPENRATVAVVGPYVHRYSPSGSAKAMSRGPPPTVSPMYCRPSTM